MPNLTLPHLLDKFLDFHSLCPEREKWNAEALKDKESLIPLKNEINDMLSFLISPEPLTISMDTLVKDFQYPQVDMIDIDIDYM